MKIEKVDFKTILQSEVEFIKKEFLDIYLSNTKKIDKENLNKISDSFCELIEYISFQDEQKSFELCETLAHLGIKNFLSYVTFSYEFTNLERVILERLYLKDEKENIAKSYKFFAHLENIIAKIYLDNSLANLFIANNIRISNLDDSYNREIVKYYKSHLEWLNKIINSLKAKDESLFPQTNSTLCDFGKWLLENGKSVILDNQRYEEILTVHRDLHLVAVNIKELLKEDNKNHIILNYLEKLEFLSLSLGEKLVLLDNSLIIQESTKDQLTGALNKQNIEQIYLNQLELSLVTSESFIFAMCNLDYFQDINDTFSYEAGNKMLENFVFVAKNSLRSSDMIIRCDGDEFVLILPAIKTEKARDILNKIRIEFDNDVLEYQGKKISTTLSMGFIEINPENCDANNTTFKNILSLTKEKLKKAKDEGKNRVC